MSTMTFDQAMEIRRRQIQGRTGFDQSAVEEAIVVIARGRPLGDAASRPIPYAALCACGQRYGMHRMADFACPNQRWRPGNGAPQWLAETFQRANT